MVECTYSSSSSTYKLYNENEKEIEKLHSHINFLHHIVTTPQKLLMYKFENIQLYNDTFNVHQQISSLFYAAKIPFAWVIDIQHETKPTPLVVITLINYLVRVKTKEMLNNYFFQNSNNTLCVL